MSIADGLRLAAETDLNRPLEVLCHDGPLLAVNKPAGILTQGGPAAVPSLADRARQYLSAQKRLSSSDAAAATPTSAPEQGRIYLGVPHRIDRPVSGVVVLATNSKAAARLSEQFERREVEKHYLAVVRGTVPTGTQVLVDWLQKVPDVAHVVVVTASTPDAKRAELELECLAHSAGHSLVQIRLITGRMHQIRVQLAARSWPIAGDEQYAPAAVENQTAATPAAVTTAIALHAWQLTLWHPIRYERVIVRAPLPSHWHPVPGDWQAITQSHLPAETYVTTGQIRLKPVPSASEVPPETDE